MSTTQRTVADRHREYRRNVKQFHIPSFLLPFTAEVEEKGAVGYTTYIVNYQILLFFNKSAKEGLSL